ncbi:MAG: type II and III secretion system protein family protein [Candidatus Binatia bacterium]
MADVGISCVAVVLAASWLVPCDVAHAADRARLVSAVSPSNAASLNARGDKVLRVMAGKSIVVDFKNKAERVAVTDEETADVVLVSPEQILVNGLQAGETSVIVWDTLGKYSLYNVVVVEEADEQVMLEVIVAEVDRSELDRRGLDIRSMGGQFGGVTQGGGAAPLFGQHPAAAGQPPFPVSLAGGLSLAVIDFKNDIGAFLKASVDDNLAHILAEPKLLARSGQTASFLSGGEIPIVITQDLQTSIDFKEFGTKVEFVPYVGVDGSIDLQVFAEVSQPDFSQGVELFGFTVPAFASRRAETNVRLTDGQSLVIAGLLKETESEFESKVPLLGDIPIFGLLFRRSENRLQNTELVMVVKPHVVKRVGQNQAKAAALGKDYQQALDLIKDKVVGRQE